MNILIQGSMRSFQVHYSLCNVFHDRYPSAKFAYFSRDISTMGLFENSKKPIFKTYNPYDYDRRFDNESNVNLIREFEKYSGMSIWRMLAADRLIGWSDYVGNYGTFIDKNHRMDRKYLMNEIANDIRRFSDMFNDFKPDIFIPAKAMGTVSVFILEALCKKSGVKYLLPEYSRVSNLHRISENVLTLSPEIDNEFQVLMKEGNIADYKKGKKLFDKLTDDFNKLDNFDTKFTKTYGLKEINNIFDSFKLFIKITFEIITDLINFIKQCIRSANNPSLKFSHIFYKLKLALVLRSQKYSNHRAVLNKSFGQLPEDQQKYLYFPLYNIPEYSSNFQSTMWLDIVSVVETLSKSIPSDWIIVLKEHPTGVNYNFRQKNFYTRISKVPNVIFAPLLADSNALISNAELVFVTVGTSGWEAILKGKPLLSPIENFWDCMQLSRKSSDIENLYEDIKKTVSDNIKISRAEREKRLIIFLEVLLNNSFPISDPEVFSYYYDGTKEQYDRQGLELAEGLIKFMKKVNIDKSIGNKNYFEYDSNEQESSLDNS
jgi:hypothetical protein